MSALRIGDTVLAIESEHEGVEGQVWVEPANGVVLIATGKQFIKVREQHLQLVERQLPEPKRPTDRTAKIVKARKVHDCDGLHVPIRGCIGIKPGSQYVRAVMFPGDNNASSRPDVMKLCLICARTWDDTDPARLAVKS